MKEKNKKILIMTTTLDLGGITVFTKNLCNFLSSEGYDITLMYTADKKNFLKSLRSDIRLKKYKMPRKKKILFNMLRQGYFMDVLRIKFRKKNEISPMKSLQKLHLISAKSTEKILEKYDIAISTAEFYCNNVVALNVKANFKIAWIHPNYGSLKVDKKKDLEILEKFNKIVTVSKNCKKSLIEEQESLSVKVVSVENLSLLDEVRIRNYKFPEEFDSSKLNILTVARLDNSSKRLDRAIKVAKHLKENGLNFKWFLIGEGKDESSLKQLVKELELENEFIFLGAIPNPYSYFKNADLFILTSQYEGKPIVVDEALALGCPVIVTNYNSAKEQVSEKYGKVVSNKDELINLEILNTLKQKKWLKNLKKNLKNYKLNDGKIKNKIIKLIEGQEISDD